MGDCLKRGLALLDEFLRPGKADGAIPVRLPEDPDHPGMHEKDLRLVVVRGFEQTAMLILTSILGDGSKEDV